MIFKVPPRPSCAVTAILALRQLRHGEVKCLLPECLSIKELQRDAFIPLLLQQPTSYALKSCVLYLILYHSVLYNSAWILKMRGRGVVGEGAFVKQEFKTHALCSLSSHITSKVSGNHLI